jgi:hypothetical protein
MKITTLALAAVLASVLATLSSSAFAQAGEGDSNYSARGGGYGAYGYARHRHGR